MVAQLHRQGLVLLRNSFMPFNSFTAGGLHRFPQMRPLLFILFYLYENRSEQSNGADSFLPLSMRPGYHISTPTANIKTFVDFIFFFG